jgi:hypothetical protein
VPIGIEDALCGKDAIRRDKIREESWLDGAAGRWRRLCGSGTRCDANGHQDDSNGCNHAEARSTNHSIPLGCEIFADGLAYMVNDFLSWLSPAAAFVRRVCWTPNAKAHRRLWSAAK